MRNDAETLRGEVIQKLWGQVEHVGGLANTYGNLELLSLGYIMELGNDKRCRRERMKASFAKRTVGECLVTLLFHLPTICAT